MKPPTVSTLPLSVLAPSAWQASGDAQTYLFDVGAERHGPLPIWNARTAELVRGEDLVRRMIEGGASYHARAFVVDLTGPEAASLAYSLENETIRAEEDLPALRVLVAEVHLGAPALHGVLTPEAEGLFAAHCLIQGTPAAARPGQRRLFA